MVVSIRAPNAIAVVYICLIVHIGLVSVLCALWRFVFEMESHREHLPFYMAAGFEQDSTSLTKEVWLSIFNKIVNVLDLQLQGQIFGIPLSFQMLQNALA